MLCPCRVQIALHSIGFIYICISIKNSQILVMMRLQVSNYLCISIVSSLMLKDRVAKRLSYQTSDLRVAGSNPVSVIFFCLLNAPVIIFTSSSFICATTSRQRLIHFRKHRFFLNPNKPRFTYQGYRALKCFGFLSIVCSDYGFLYAIIG